MEKRQKECMETWQKECVEIWREEWLEKLMGQPQYAAPLPMPENLKIRILKRAARQQALEKRQTFLHYAKICTAVCMAVLLLAGSNGSLPEGQDISQGGGASGWMREVQKQMDGFASEIHQKMNEAVQTISWNERMGGQEI